MSKKALLAPPISFLCALVVSMSPAVADSSTPVNYISNNFSPITTTTSSNYDFDTGTVTAGTASASVFSTANVVQNTVSDPGPPPTAGFGTFIGTARPVPSPTGGGAVLYEQSGCPTGCLVNGTLTYGYMVMYALRGLTLGEVTNLQAMYYVENGCFGGGSPRFSFIMSNGSEIHVYFGTYPAFRDCPLPDTWQSTGQFASDAAGLRWDTSQVCPGTFYNTYSGAVMCADTLGLTISAVVVGTDGGWSQPDGNQTFLFEEIQMNQLTRFP